MPALNAYAETIMPKRAGLIDSEGMMTAPSGAMTMKSRMTANCRKASRPAVNFW